MLGNTLGNLSGRLSAMDKMNTADMLEFAELVGTTIVSILEERGVVQTANSAACATTANCNLESANSNSNVKASANSKLKNANSITNAIANLEPVKRDIYQITEDLLKNYCGFQRIIKTKLQEIEDIKKYGVPKQFGGERVQNGNLPKGIILPEESIDSAVKRIENSMKETIQIVNLIDTGMWELRFDPYYDILKMTYIEGRTQEDIAYEMNINQATISRNKKRLIKALAMCIFPDKCINELLEGVGALAEID